MKRFIILLIVFILVWLGMRWVFFKMMDDAVQSQPKTCPIWLRDSPQAGCEGK